MEITTENDGDLIELHLQGVLDNNWSGQLSQAVDDAIRQGTHRLLIDLSGVTYLSSAGVGVLIHAQKRLQSIQGFFGVSQFSPQCREVLKLSGLLKLLECDAVKVRNTSAAAMRTTQPEFFLRSENGFNFEVYDVAAGAKLRCQAWGRPERLAAQGFSSSDSRVIEFGQNEIGLGLGALGGSFDECRDRFGEFLSVAGSISQQPAAEGYAPDYQLAQDLFRPSIQTLYGLRATGDFARLIRFEPAAERLPLGLSALAEQCLAVAEADVAAVVLVAETAGVVGASLKRSPVAASSGHASGNGGANFFQHPEIRKWLSFTPERMYPRSLTLVAGIVARSQLAGPAQKLAPFLRPVFGKGSLLGHFHAGVFSYRPLKKGRLDLAQTARLLFESEQLQAVLHLIGDPRAIVGAGESEFLAGVGWVGPVSDISVESA